MMDDTIRQLKKSLKASSSVFKREESEEEILENMTKTSKKVVVDLDRPMKEIYEIKNASCSSCKSQQSCNHVAHLRRVFEEVIAKQRSGHGSIRSSSSSTHFCSGKGQCICKDISLDSCSISEYEAATKEKVSLLEEIQEMKDKVSNLTSKQIRAINDLMYDGETLEQRCMELIHFFSDKFIPDGNELSKHILSLSSLSDIFLDKFAEEIANLKEGDDIDEFCTKWANRIIGGLIEVTASAKDSKKSLGSMLESATEKISSTSKDMSNDARTLSEGMRDLNLFREKMAALLKKTEEAISHNPTNCPTCDKRNEEMTIKDLQKMMRTKPSETSSVKTETSTKSTRSNLGDHTLTLSVLYRDKVGKAMVIINDGDIKMKVSNVIPTDDSLKRFKEIVVGLGEDTLRQKTSARIDVDIGLVLDDEDYDRANKIIYDALMM